MLVDVDASPNDALREGAGEWLPKIGLQVEAPDAADEFEWYGRGPVETYPDRKRGVPVGRYSGSVEDQQFAYLPPTDNGNKTDTRWARIGDASADGSLLASAPGTMSISVTSYSNLAEAEYQYELEERGSVAFNLDHGVTGVGGTPNPPRRVPGPADGHLLHRRPAARLGRRGSDGAPPAVVRG